MSDRPTNIGEVGEELYRALAPAFTDSNDLDWSLLTFCGAWGLMLEQYWYVLHGGEFPWQVVFDPDTCPLSALPWLAQFVGVRIQPSFTEEQTRQAIKDKQGMERGKPSAILDAVRNQLTGTKHVVMTERTGGDAWALTIRTYTSETPDENLVRAAILVQKPAGIILDYAAVPGATFAEVAAAYASLAAVEAGNADLGDVLTP